MKTHITAITHSGVHKFTKEEIQEMLDDMDLYWSADNLPKWLFACSLTEDRRATIKMLKIFLKNKPQTIDVRY